MKACKKLLSMFMVWQLLAGTLPTASAISMKEKVPSNEFYMVTKENNEITSNSEKSQPKVSVIVPVYNTERYLRECLDSIKNQTLTDIEIICVDDGSTDNCGKILDEYAANDSRFIVIHQENKGGAAARNAGMMIATGEYIAFVDSDDTIDENAYSVSYENIKEVDADILIFGEDKCNLRDKFFKSGVDALYCGGMWGLWNKLYKKEFLTNNNFKIPEHAKAHHDECFNAVVLPKANGVCCIKDKFYHYRRQRPGSIQTSLNAKERTKYYLIYADYVCSSLEENERNNKKYTDWFLKKIKDMRNRVIDKLSVEDRSQFESKLMDIINKANICGETDIRTLFRPKSDRVCC